MLYLKFESVHLDAAFLCPHGISFSGLLSMNKYHNHSFPYECILHLWSSCLLSIWMTLWIPVSSFCTVNWGRMGLGGGSYFWLLLAPKRSRLWLGTTRRGQRSHSFKMTPSMQLSVLLCVVDVYFARYNILIYLLSWFYCLKTCKIQVKLQCVHARLSA